MTDQPINHLIIRMIHEVRMGAYDKDPRADEAKLTAWCGVQAWMRFRREVDLAMLRIGDVRHASSLLYCGCAFMLDPDQPEDDITLCRNGAPVRQLDTKTRDLTVFMGPPGVMAHELAALAAAFRDGPMRVAESPILMALKPDPKAAPEDPIVTRSYSMQDWMEQGLVYMPATRTYALTLAGKNAVEQFKAWA